MGRGGVTIPVVIHIRPTVNRKSAVGFILDYVDNNLWFYSQA